MSALPFYPSSTGEAVSAWMLCVCVCVRVSLFVLCVYLSRFVCALNMYALHKRQHNLSKALHRICFCFEIYLNELEATEDIASSFSLCMLAPCMIFSFHTWIIITFVHLGALCACVSVCISLCVCVCLHDNPCTTLGLLYFSYKQLKLSYSFVVFFLIYSRAHRDSKKYYFIFFILTTLRLFFSPGLLSSVFLLWFENRKCL